MELQADDLAATRAARVVCRSYIAARNTRSNEPISVSSKDKPARKEWLVSISVEQKPRPGWSRNFRFDTRSSYANPKLKCLHLAPNWRLDGNLLPYSSPLQFRHPTYQTIIGLDELRTFDTVEQNWQDKIQKSEEPQNIFNLFRFVESRIAIIQSFGRRIKRNCPQCTPGSWVHHGNSIIEHRPHEGFIELFAVQTGPVSTNLCVFWYWLVCKEVFMFASSSPGAEIKQELLKFTIPVYLTLRF